MKKIKVLVAALVAFSVSSVFAPLASAQEKVQVTFWHAMNGPHQEMVTSLVEEFNASQDTVEVVEQNQGDYSTLQQSIMASAASGNLPTMTQLTSSNTPDFKDQGLLIALDDLMTDDNGWTTDLVDGIYPGFIDGVTYDGSIYAIPFSKSVRIMYVNEDMLAEVGAEIPTTWQEVLDLGVALDEAGIDKPAMGLENSISMELETMARQNGAAWVSPDLTEVEIASETATEPAQFIYDLIAAGHARTAGEDGFMSGPFSSGESALYIGSSAGLSYVLPGIEESGITLATAELPVFGEGEPLTLFAGNDLGVFSSATEEEQAGAAQFMAFLLEAENTARWASETGYLPITVQGTESETWTAFLAGNPLVEAATAELPYGMSQPGYVGASEVFNEIEMAIERILLSDADITVEFQAIEDLVKGHLGLE
ncbi:extracellular solute-binding protein [Aerococcaceae bacterium WS4759]|uniref:Extracellular solute-binding protein n=1 Tax=Fundicoccus ignavus TaxID=2664442 RepID=A0A6I2GKF5_9LACT|nr:ABC transporter substrate-binding protein [Fundicoccus ignavus]MRI85729.1 extracellular solute-binding protein [Fundicoccus ignavus]